MTFKYRRLVLPLIAGIGLVASAQLFAEHAPGIANTAVAVD